MGRAPLRVATYAAVAAVLLVTAYWFTGQLFGALCESDCTEQEASPSWVLAGLVTLTLMLAVVAIGEALANWQSRRRSTPH